MIDERAVVLEPGGRLDAAAVDLLEGVPSRSSARKWAKAGRLLLNGEVVESSRRVCVGDVLTVAAERERPVYDRALEVLHCDDDVAIVVKPAGLLVNGNRLFTVENALLTVLGMSPASDGISPRPVHRLDFETMGALVVARTHTGLIELSRAFEERRVDKRYVAFAHGRLEGEQRYDSPIDGREATSLARPVSHFRSLKLEWITEVELVPITGRMHQLRRHLAGAGHQLIGDRRYGDGPVYKGHGLFLVAAEVRLPHPRTGETVVATVEVPRKFALFRDREERRWRQHRCT